MKEDGSFDEIVVDGISYSGQALMDYVDRKVQNAYFMAEESPEKEDAMDFMWYLSVSYTHLWKMVPSHSGGALA